MSNTPRRVEAVRLVELVNRYSTPFAILLVAMGIILSNPIGWARNLSITLLLAGVLLNIAVVAWLRRRPDSTPWLVPARMTANVLINISLVYVLGRFWPPLWLLLALTPLASAIYSDRRRTLVAATGVSAALAGVAWLHGASSPIEWGTAAAQAAFIVLVSLMVNDLAALGREG